MSAPKEEILPCPFCGSPASVEEFASSSVEPKKVVFSVGCDSQEEDSCMGYQSFTTYSRRADAIAAWNKRVPTILK